MDESLNHHLNGPTDIIMNLNVIEVGVILPIPAGPTTFNDCDGGDTFSRLGPQGCNAIVNCCVRNHTELTTSKSGSVGLKICGRSLNHDTKIQLIPEKKIWQLQLFVVPLYYALSPNVGDINNLPLIKLQEVFTPARPTIIIQTIQRYKVFIISQNKVINMARYTTEEIENNYEFKVMKRLIKKEFPFITDMKLTDNWSDYNSLLFVDVSLNPYLLMEHLNIPDIPSSKRYLRVFSHSIAYLSMLFPSSFNRDESISNLAKKVQATITRVHQSPSIPDDMRLPRPVSISGWGVDGHIVNIK